MAAEHKFLKFILPTKAFEVVRKGRKLWLIERPCGHKHDLWEAGGVRYKAAGRPRQIARGPICGNATMPLVRKKTKAEMKEMAYPNKVDA